MADKRLAETPEVETTVQTRWIFVHLKWIVWTAALLALGAAWLVDGLL